jgi:hypothetical protein
MELLLRFRATPRLTGLGAPLAALALWMSLVVAFELLNESRGGGATACIFRNLTGVPCPTCGATRAARAMLAGHPVEAVLWNPLLVTGGAVASMWVAVVAVSGRGRDIRIGPRWRTWLWASAALAFAANWAYIIAHDAGR